MRRLISIINVACAVVLMAVADDVSAAPTVVGRVGLVAGGQLRPDALAVGKRDGRALVTVRVPGGAARLRQAGFDARPLAGDVADLRATAADLRLLFALPDVITVEERRILRPLLDASGPAIGAPAARTESGLDGAGTLVALVDTGVDFRHADLRHADGTTRVAAILDYVHPRGDLHPELPDYNGGAIWLQADIDATLAADGSGTPAPIPVTEQDTNGHGTHVAGIAASGGLATGRGLPSGRYVGVAPGAGIIAVQATHGDATFTDSDVITGCRFAVEQAQRLGRPVVANLSLGSNTGPHDGSSDLEAALDQLFPGDQPGRALVIAAGNEGGSDQHAGAWALDGSVTASVDTASSSQADAHLAFELWHTGSFAITIVSPAGRRYGPVKPGVVFNGPMTSEGQVLVDNGATSAPRADGRQPASVVVEGAAGAAPASGRWSLVLEGHAPRWDIWISDEPSAATPAHFVDHVAEDDRLDMPATAHNAIVVGSFVTRNQWTTIDGTPVTRTAVVGVPSSFSSSGPTADNRFAPDVVAPGEYIMSALSSGASPDNPTSAFFVAPNNHLTWGDDGAHAILRGTSQAAPHVAGTVALLFQADPTLSAAAVREILRVTARDDGAGFTPKLGFGKLDVLAATRYVGGLRGATASATSSSIGLSRDIVPPGDETSVVTVTPRDDDGVPLGGGHDVTITATAGDPIGDVVDVGSGRYERTFAAHASRGTVATIAATVDGVALAAHPAIYIVNARDEI
ncbi:MAG TPA: S8 family serine peptidase, partial [Polyangia bacterium]|nr:S8 family serine peptidase [Polyangia bacterium]